MFLLFSLLFWSFFGWLADYSFPFGQAFELFFACFKGTVTSKINSFQQQLQRTDIVSQPDNQQQVQKLNELEYKAWLYEGILERLSENSSINHEKVARTLEALEYKRSEIKQELEPRKPRRYRIFAGLQYSVRSVLASKAEKDYEKLSTLVTKLVLFARGRQPSQVVISEVINELASEIEKNQNQITTYRLRLAYKVDDLLKTISTKLVFDSEDSTTDSSYQNIVNELQSQLDLLSNQLNSLLKSRKESSDKLDRRVQEIYELTQKVSNLHQKISNRDTDIETLKKYTQDLEGLSQEQKFQIDTFQSSIFSLQENIQKLSDINIKQKEKNNELYNQTKESNQKIIDLEERIKQISYSAKDQEQEFDRLKQENLKISIQNTDLKGKYQKLFQYSEQQESEILNLKEKLKKKAQNSRRATNSEISIEEYKTISNKQDYTYVRPHTRNGYPVKGHYRRKRGK